jgi:hypothetical protein
VLGPRESVEQGIGEAIEPEEVHARAPKKKQEVSDAQVWSTNIITLYVIVIIFSSTALAENIQTDLDNLMTNEKNRLAGIRTKDHGRAARGDGTFVFVSPSSPDTVAHSTDYLRCGIDLEGRPTSL